jgi:preprotein translocase subunit SecF
MPPANEIIPQQVVDISLAFFFTMAAIIIGLPIARAFARRMDRKGGSAAQIPTEVSAQLAHLGQAVDAIAVEVERISEGQRFTTRLLSEQRDAARSTLPSAVER